MSLTQPSRAVLAGVLLAVGCADESTTALPAAHFEEAVDLALLMPGLIGMESWYTEAVEATSAPGPPGVLSQDPPEEPEEESAKILSAWTDAGFTATYASSAGHHRYTGNVGRVETVATLLHDGQVLGTQFAARQESVPFLFDWGSIKSIWAEAYIFTDQECGLQVKGDSKHWANWEWFVGSSAPDWGSAQATTQSFPPVDQPPCEDDATEEGSSGGGSGSGGSSTITCWYWVTYDLDSGEVVDADLLYCEEGG